MKQINSIQDKVDAISEDVALHQADPIGTLYGTELGTAKLVRDDRTFRIFVKEVQKAKSGKAVLVEMKVFIQKGGEEFAVVRGHTYIPNFVLENKDVYWILENKIHNKTTDDPSDGNIYIDKQYIQKEFNTYGNFWSNANDNTPEVQAQNFLNMMTNMKRRFEQELKLEVNTLAFMELVA